MKFSALDLDSLSNLDDYSVILTVFVTHRSHVYRDRYYVPLRPTWQLFVDFLEMTIADKPIEIKYKDEDSDMISISSDLEWNEAINVAKRNGNRIEVFVMSFKPFVTLRNDEDGEPLQFASNGETNERSCEKVDSEEEVTRVPTKESEEKGEEGQDRTQLPPKWFTDYMDKFKGDLVTEIVKKVNRRVQKLVIGERTTVVAANELDATSPSESNRGAVPKKQLENVPSCASASICQLAFGLDKMSSGSCKVSATTADLPIHRGIHCQMCHKEIIGVRYKCGNCAEFDLCAACEGSNQCHFPEHVFIKIRKPAVGVGLRKKSGKVVPLLKHVLYSKDDQHGSLGRCNKRKLTPHKWEKTIQKYFGNACNPDMRTYQFLPRETFVSKLSNSILDPLKPIKLTMDAAFVNDETIPDGTKFLPGVRFTKAWCIVNSGSRPWTHETTLKCLWGTKGFIPNSMEVVVPPLFPQQHGQIYVDYCSPTGPGFYESHWNFVHKGHLFGHRIWCSIEVTNPEVDCFEEGDVVAGQCPPIEIQEPENGETAIINGLQTEECRHVNELVPDDIQERKTQFLSQTVTPNNTPFVLSPPKSPEPSDLEKEIELRSLPDSDVSLTNDDMQAMTDSEIASVISWNSSDSESEFVLVPMPPCFNFVAMSDNCCSPALPSPDKSGLLSSSSSSVMFIGSDGEDVTTRTDPNGPVCDHSYAKPVVLPNETMDAIQMLRSGSTSTVYEEPTNNSDTDAAKILKRLSSETGEVLVTLNDTDEENNNHSSSSETTQDSNSEIQSTNSDIDEVDSGEPVVPGLQIPPECSESVGMDDSARLTRELIVPYVSYDLALYRYRVVNVLPESLVLAAATIFNSARTAFSAMQWVPSQPSELPTSLLQPQTTGLRRSEPTLATDEEVRTIPISPMSVNMLLSEMGFYNSQLNAELVEKHCGDLEKILDELVRHDDTDWFRHRH